MSSKLCLTTSLLGQFPTGCNHIVCMLVSFTTCNYLLFLEAPGQGAEEQPHRRPQDVRRRRSSVAPAVPERDRNPGHAAGTDAVGLALPGTIAGMVGAMGAFGLAALGMVLWMELSRPGKRSKVAQIP